ncbi:ABC transporter permease [Nocardia goodfellowii]|uniref:Transport permease protein n=1 Tax=Nocardia goodfellowii TaxID=882446 RepID=A0ABS4Q9S3_9NOCA|nr:ABC transporter permease [Nocardia goodfellowii]MBP2188397.1 ABC-2 type transport system permease protein [Nocardia goodfellowii]
MTTAAVAPPKGISMSTAFADSMTMLRRNLLHAKRYPSLTISVVVMPVVLLFIFNFVFGGALEAGASGGTKYINYLTPGMLLLLPAYLTAAVAVSVSTDVTKGIVNRFRSMSISQSAILTGHVLGTLIQSLLGLAAMAGAGLLAGWRPEASPIEWLAAIGLLSTITFAFTWLSVAFGLVAPNPESASNMPFPIIMMPFLGSGLVPTDTMPMVLRQFAEYQPFTPFTETVRGLLMGTEIGNSGWISLAWCAVIAGGGYLWSKSLFRKQGR